MTDSAITIVGLGPGDARLLTREAWQVLSKAEEVYARTAHHPVLAALPDRIQRHGFDHLYEQLDDYALIYRTIVERILELAQRPEGVIYAVPGDPTVGESTVGVLLERAAELSLPVRLIHGVSFVEPSLAALGIDGLDGLVLADAIELAAGHHPPFGPDQPALIGQLHSRQIAADVKLTLLNQYPAELEVVLIHHAGTSHIRVERCPLHQVDHQRDFSSLTSLFVPPLSGRASFAALQETVAHLRAPEGCPWDREQTHLTLRTHLMEEAYEALQALDAEDLPALKEELGDLLLQIVLQTQIATEEGDFQMAEVIAGINEKLHRRHPHVFGGTELSEVDQVLRNWERLKEAERAHEGKEGSALEGVPLTLPALAQAAELQSRASRVGFDWRSIQGVLAKIGEEVTELSGAPPERKASELGDLLFALVNFARWMEIDPEAELRKSNQRFRSRFNRLSELAAAQGSRLEQLSLEELDELWEAAKAEGDA